MYSISKFVCFHIILILLNFCNTSHCSAEPPLEFIKEIHNKSSFVKDNSPKSLSIDMIFSTRLDDDTNGKEVYLVQNNFRTSSSIINGKIIYNSSLFSHDTDYNVNMMFFNNTMLGVNTNGKIFATKKYWDFVLDSTHIDKSYHPTLVKNDNQGKISVDINNLIENLILKFTSEFQCQNKVYSIYSRSLDDKLHIDVRLNSPTDHKFFNSWLSSMTFSTYQGRVVILNNFLLDKDYFNLFTPKMNTNNLEKNSKLGDTLEIIKTNTDDLEYPDVADFDFAKGVNKANDQVLYYYLFLVGYTPYSTALCDRETGGSYYKSNATANAFLQLMATINAIDKDSKRDHYDFYQRKTFNKSSAMYKVSLEYLVHSTSILRNVVDDIFQNRNTTSGRMTWIDDPSYKWKYVSHSLDPILLTRLWKHCGIRFALEDKLDLHARYAFIATLADLGCPNMIYESREMLNKISENPVFTAILSSRWKMPFENKHVEAVVEALKKTEQGEPAETALIETLIMLDEINKVDKEKLEAWYLSQVVYANQNRRGIQISMLTGIPSGRDWIASRLKNSNDPATLKTQTRKILLERVNATEELERFDYMTQEDCKKFKAACSEKP